MLRLGRVSMGCLYEILVDERFRPAAEAALDEVDRLDEQMSLFRPGSELCEINRRAAREDVLVEPRLYRLLLRAQELWRDTEGAFDIAVEPLMEAFGFYEGRVDPRRAKRISGMKHVRLRDGKIRFTRAGVALDLGGIGKGFAVDRAAAVLRDAGATRALLHGGSSTIYAIGDWEVGLVDRGRRIDTVKLRDEALSTSSSFEQNHILDPRTGKPVDGRCAWAFSTSATDADALSTAFVILGKDWAKRHGYRARFSEGVSRRDFLKGAAAAAAVAAATPAQAQDSGREVKLAVIGLGDQGLLLLSQLSRIPGVKVPAVCDLRKAQLDRAIQMVGRQLETYEDYKYLLDEETVDGVIVATPTHLHAEAAVAALAKGRAVYVEAPLARTAEDCRAIVQAADKKICQVGHQRRTGKLYPHAYTHFQSGAIGKAVQIRAQWHRRISWRKTDDQQNWRLYRKSSGGLLLEYGAHVLDLANWFFDAVPESVTGFGAIQHWKDGREVEDTVQAIWRYPGGRIVQFSGSLVTSFGDESELIVGDAASMLFLKQRKGLLFKEADTVSAGWEAYAKKEMYTDQRGILLDAEATKFKKQDEPELIGIEAEKADAFAALEQFVASIRKGTAPACDARAGMRAAVAAIAGAEAVSQGKIMTFTKEQFE